MKKILSLCLILALAAALLCSCGKKETYGEPFNAPININTTGHVLHNVEITVKNYGIITPYWMKHWRPSPCKTSSSSRTKASTTD